MAETWPDPGVIYRYPAATADNEERWQAAITAGLGDGSLKLTPRGKDATDFYDLTGQCPRCGHDMDKSLEFSVIVGVLPVRHRHGTFNVQCNCVETHAGRDDKHKGCGWGGAIDVFISVA